MREVGSTRTQIFIRFNPPHQPSPHYSWSSQRSVRNCAKASLLNDLQVLRETTLSSGSAQITAWFVNLVSLLVETSFFNLSI